MVRKRITQSHNLQVPIANCRSGVGPRPALYRLSDDPQNRASSVTEPERNERVARNGAGPPGAEATRVTSALRRAPGGAVPRQDLLAERRRSRGGK